MVSINLCTDQLALDLAAPGQLVSVSRRSHNPTSSARYKQARAIPPNGSGAEEVYLLRPDLVLAGTFTSTATVQMLENLGIPVIRFAPARALSDIPDRLRQMGDALGQPDKAAEIIATFHADLNRLSAPPPRRPRAAISYVNNYTAGDKTLAGDILRAAGFHNIATDAGLSRSGVLRLEQLIMLAPEVIITGRNYPGTARAEDNLTHPALRALTGTTFAAGLTDRDWVCGTPRVLEAVKTLRTLHAKVLAE